MTTKEVLQKMAQLKDVNNSSELQHDYLELKLNPHYKNIMILKYNLQ